MKHDIMMTVPTALPVQGLRFMMHHGCALRICAICSHLKRKDVLKDSAPLYYIYLYSYIFIYLYSAPLIQK